MEIVDILDPGVDLRWVLVSVFDRPIATDETATLRGTIQLIRHNCSQLRQIIYRSLADR